MTLSKYFQFGAFVSALSAQPSLTADPLVVGTWGGAYEAAQDIALFEPFAKTTGLDIQKSKYSGGLDVFDDSEQPHVLDMLAEDAMIACDAGQLSKLPDDVFATGSTYLANPADFLAGAITQCSIAHLTFSTLIAFDERAFPNEKPRSIRDFFDTENFPGKRAVQKNPGALFEWALMAEGVPVSQIYDLLSTERGMRLVLSRLDSIREHLIWWSTPAESVEFLENQTAVMASGYNGRFFDARARDVPLTIIWDGQIVDRSVWAVPSSQSLSLSEAIEFIRFATQPQRMAAMAELIPYGPTRKSAYDYIGRHPEYGMDMVPQLPTTPRHLQTALIRDTRWYASTSEFRRSNFERWLTQQ